MVKFLKDKEEIHNELQDALYRLNLAIEAYETIFGEETPLGLSLGVVFRKMEGVNIKLKEAAKDLLTRRLEETREGGQVSLETGFAIARLMEGLEEKQDDQ